MYWFVGTHCAFGSMKSVSKIIPPAVCIYVHKICDYSEQKRYYLTQGYLEKINVYGNPDAINVTCMPPLKATIAPTTAVSHHHMEVTTKPDQPNALVGI